MLEVIGDLWTYGDYPMRCITTNGYVKRSGEAVMGRGCAKEAAERWPELPFKLGSDLSGLFSCQASLAAASEHLPDSALSPAACILC